tara:strand:+ start:57 stop:482 length:426 start_codon:yes stop_codon:yes gene_type:complete
MITLDDVKLFNLRNFIEPDGNLVPIESKHDIPFDIKRIFYVHGVKNQDDRGKHSHHKTKQVLICLNGEVKVTCDDGKNKKIYTLSNPTQALYIPEMIWDEQTYKSEDSVLLVLANTHYDINDYIEDYDEFILLKEKNENNK